MANGYAGKIVRVNLTTKAISTIDTAKYQEFGGGYGIGSAVFWDLAVAPGQWDLQNAYDPRSVLVLMSGLLAATGVPGRKNERLRRISGGLSGALLLQGKLRRQVCHDAEACRMGRHCS